MATYRVQPDEDGSVVIPAEVLKQLGHKPGDTLELVIAADVTVHIRLPRYPSIDSLAGAAGSLPQPLTWHEMRRIAQEDREAHFRRKLGLSTDDTPPERSAG